MNACNQSVLFLLFFGFIAHFSGAALCQPGYNKAEPLGLMEQHIYTSDALPARAAPNIPFVYTSVLNSVQNDYLHSSELN